MSQILHTFYDKGDKETLLIVLLKICFIIIVRGERVVMEQNQYENIKNHKKRNYTPLIWVISIIAIAIILGINYLPRSLGEVDLGFDLTLLPLFNAIVNGIAFILLLLSLIMIKRKNIKAHRRFIYAAFGFTFVFLISYLTYHAFAASTSYGGSGMLMYIYYFILITHIVLAAAVLPLSLITLARGLNMEVEKHRKIARWTMPIWLYVSATGVLVYILISPYY